MTDHGKYTICWLDLETTGQDHPWDGSIIEIGCVFTDPGLRETGVFHSVVAPVESAHLDGMRAAVRKMHIANGLLEELRWDSPSVDNVDHLLSEFIRMAVEESPQKRVALAGSGVLHYDNRWLLEHMPKSRKKMTYWGYDVGAVRRFLRDHCGYVHDGPAPNKNHRALDDARLALDEARLYSDLIRGAINV